MGSWYEQVKSGKFPTCPEICEDCISGKHVFHMLGELSDLWAEWETVVDKTGIEHKSVSLFGWAEDELWLEQLLKFIADAYHEKM